MKSALLFQTLIRLLGKWYNVTMFFRWGSLVFLIAFAELCSAATSRVVSPTDSQNPGGSTSQSPDPIPYILFLEGQYDGSVVQLSFQSLVNCPQSQDDLRRVIYNFNNSVTVTLDNFSDVTTAGTSSDSNGNTLFHCSTVQTAVGFPEDLTPGSASLFYSVGFSITGQVTHGVVITGNAGEGGSSGFCGLLSTNRSSVSPLILILITVLSLLLSSIRRHWHRF